MSSAIRVLHVDDDPAFVDTAATFLEREREAFEVATENAAEDALDRLADGGFDCVISDYDMPGADGLELLAAVRKDHPELPFVLFTGKGGEEIASEAISAGVTDYLQKGSGTGQYEILANRVENAVDQHRAEHRAATQSRINAIVNKVNQSLVRAESRPELERTVCDVLAAADPYLFAWIGAYDAGTATVVPEYSAGLEAGYLDDLSIPVEEPPAERGPAGEAVRTGEIRLSQDVATDPGFEPWRAEALERGYRSVAAVPLVHDGQTYGVCCVYADRTDAFDDEEVDLLRELGDDVAHALHAMALRDDLERYETVVEAAGDPVYAADAAGRFTFVNEALTELTGYDADELLGEHVSTIMPDSDVERGRELVRGLLDGDGRSRATYEMEVFAADGERLTCETHIALLPPEDGFVGSTGIVRDVTDRERREAALRDHKGRIERLHQVAADLGACESREAVYREVVAAAEDILEFDICIVDAVEDGALVPRAVSSGIPAEGYYERTPLDAEDNIAARAHRTGESILVDDLGADAAEPAAESYRSVVTVPVGDHGVFQAGAREVGTFAEADLELAELLVAHATEALDRIESAVALRAERDRFASLFENVPDPVIEYAFEDDEAVIHGVNAAFEDAFGYDAGWIAGRSVGDVLVPPDGEQRASRVGRQVRAGEQVDAEVSRATADGERTFLFRNVPVDADEPGTRGYGIYIDVTEREHRRERLQRQNERLEKFAAIVSHDLRNPLTAAAGWLELVREEYDDDRLASVAEELDRMEDLVEGVLTLARQGRTIDDPEPVAFGTVVDTAWGSLQAGGATLEREGCVGTVLGDRGRLCELLENLFRNAVEHGGADVTVRVGPTGDGFYVADDGPGVPAEDREAVFDSAYSTSETGTGLGLAIVREIAEAHGWRVDLAGSASGGARFEFSDVDAPGA